MQTKHALCAEAEAHEADRFDKSASALYQDDSQLTVESIHWEKFNVQKPIPHPYGYVVQSLGDLRGKRVLEVGCGTGLFSVILAKRGAQFIEAFDISSKSIEAARRRAMINGIAERVNFRALSIYDMDYDTNSFDTIVGINILHHIDIERIVDNVYRILKQGGVAYFLEPFGNVRWLEELRLLVPVKPDDADDDKSSWENKLKYKDAEKFSARFNYVRCLEFHLFSRMDKIFKSKRVLELLAKADRMLLLNFPFLRKYARTVVITLNK